MASFDVEVRIDVDAGSGCEAYDHVYDKLALAGVENFSVREVVDENYEEEVDLSAEDATPPAEKQDRRRDESVGAVASDGLARIAAVMSGREWSADTLDEIAAIVRAHGHELRDVAEEDADV